MTSEAELGQSKTDIFSSTVYYYAAQLFLPWWGGGGILQRARRSGGGGEFEDCRHQAEKYLQKSRIFASLIGHRFVAILA